MSRSRIVLPDSFPYSMEMPVRVSDINHGGHLGHDRVLALAHEARVGFLRSLGVEELSVGDGAGLIMADAAIEYKAEAHHGDIIRLSVTVTDISRAGFDLTYLLERVEEGKRVTVAVVRTGMVCFDYQRKKVVSIPGAFRTALGA